MFFPPKKSVGLDIADHSIEVVGLEGRGRELRVVSAGRGELPPGVVERGRIKQPEQLLEALQKVFQNAKPFPVIPRQVQVIFGLPECQTYIHIFELSHKRAQFEALAQTARDELIFQGAQRIIPLEKDDILFSYRIIQEGREKPEVLLVGASKGIVGEWQRLFQKAKINLQAIEIESLAIFHGLFSDFPKEPVCVVDMGAATSTMMIFDENGLRYSYSVNTAGDSFTNEIATTLDIPVEQAETLKRTVGLSDPNHRIFPILTKTLLPIVQELQSSLKYFQETKGGAVKEIVLVGGSSRIGKVDEYFATNLGIPVNIGKPPADLREAFGGSTDQPYLYIEALGLALRGAGHVWFADDPVLYKKIIKEVPFAKLAQRKQLIRLPITYPFWGSGFTEKKKRLFVFVGIGAALVGGALWYQMTGGPSKEEEGEPQQPAYSKTQLLELKIPVALTENAYQEGRVRGRVVDYVVSFANSYQEALAISRLEVEQKLQIGENLWQAPLEVKDKNGSAVFSEEPLLQDRFPLTVRWLLYEKDNAQLLLVQETKERLGQRDYKIGAIEQLKVEAGDNSDLLYLVGEATLMVRELIEIPQDIPTPEVSLTPSPSPAAIQAMVVVRDTPTGWLNVREGSGTTYPMITRVYPGESYLLLEEKNEWYKIKIDEDTAGWVFSGYVDKSSFQP